MKLSFRNVSVVSSAICFVLAFFWIVVPQFLLWIFQVESLEPALFVARRGGALFMGIAILLFLAREAESSKARRAIALGFATSCIILALLGIYELAARHAGIGILLAVTVESTLAVAFLCVRNEDRPIVPR
jgi:hypothetical protein